MNDTIVKQGSRILMPSEFAAIRSALKPNDQLVVDGLLATGMRVVEFWRFCKNTDWYKPSRRCIDMPRGSILKVKAKQAERTVLLSTWGVTIVEQLIKNPPREKSKQGLHQLLQRAAVRSGVNPKYINSKMFRKTLISWLVYSGYDTGLISVSAGHDTEIMQKHYLAIGFPRQEVEDIKYYTIGWGK